jgi:ketosteroid isomerase-like protein
VREGGTPLRATQASLCDSIPWLPTGRPLAFRRNWPRTSFGILGQAMSKENVQIVRQFGEHWARRDWDGMAELVDPNVEQLGTVGGVEEGSVRRGVSEIRRDYENVDETWDEHRIEIQELIDAGDRVVLFQREYQRGRSSGVELAVDAAVVVDLRDGRIVRVQGYMDRAAALKAAGLSEQDAQLDS